VQIPPWAIAFTVQDLNSPPVVQPTTAPALAGGFPIQIDVTDAASAFAVTFYYTDQTSQSIHEEQQFPLYNGAERLRLVTTDPTANLAVKIIYTLAF